MRTLKEQCLYLHQFRDLEEAREIIGAFIARYNTEWIVERLGYRTPAQARRDALKEAACGDTSSSSGPGVQDTGCATAFACVPTMRYAANRAWQLLSVLAFNLMVVFSSRPRPVARPASGAVAFRFETIHTLPYLCLNRADPLGLFPQLWALTERVQTVRRKSQSMDRRILPLAIAASFAGVHSQAYGGAVFLLGGLLLAARGRLPPG